MSSDLSGEALAKSEALAPVLRGSPATEDGKEDWSFGGLCRTPGATGSCPWGSTSLVTTLFDTTLRGDILFGFSLNTSRNLNSPCLP